MSTYSLHLSFFLATGFINISINIFLLFIYKNLILTKSPYFSMFDKIIGYYHYLSSCYYITSILVSNLFATIKIFIFIQLFFHISFNRYCFTLSKKVNHIINKKIGCIYIGISIILSWSILKDYLYFDFEEKNKNDILYVFLFGQQLYFSLSIFYITLKYLEKKFEKNIIILLFQRINISNDNNIEELNNTCPICIEPLKEKVVIKTYCKHLFHYECMENYIQHNQNNEESIIISCPTCRTTF